MDDGYIDKKEQDGRYKYVLDQFFEGRLEIEYERWKLSVLLTL